MIPDVCDVPVVFCVYNRPDFARQALAAIVRVRPRRILLVADGPKTGSVEDARRCAETLAVVREGVSGIPLEIDAAPSNLGCRKRIQSGLNWAFAQVEEAIIIEDDCIPDDTFFRYCVQLLAHYRNDNRVGLIGGARLGRAAAGDKGDSYAFSRYPLMWGWATWRRTWRIYDGDLAGWPALRGTGWLEDLLDDDLAFAYWRKIFDEVRDGFDTWDYSMLFSCWRENLLSIQPSCNLVRNIGFGAEATHTRDALSALANAATMPMTFPLRHPDKVVRDAEGDLDIERAVFSGLARKRFESAQRLARLLPRR